MAADRTGYKKVNWVNKQTALGATNLGQMDEGIKKNSDLAIECANYIDEIQEAFINQLNISYDSEDRVFVLTIGSSEGQNPTTRFNAVKAFDTQSLVIGDIYDDLDSTDSGKVLSAKQGKVLDGKIADLASTVSGHTATLQAKADLVDGKVAADQLPLAYFDKFVSGENIDAQLTEGQLAYCYAGSVYVGGNVPSTVVIRFTQTSNKAVYLKRIYVRYVNTEDQEIEYEHVFDDKDFSENNQTQELDGLNWLLKDSNNVTYFKYVNYGLQIGSGTVGIRNCAISTADLGGCTIKEVQVNACGATGTACKVSVEAAGDHWLYDEGGSSEATELTLAAKDTSSAIAFTYGEGSVPGTGSLVEYSETFIKKEDGELVTSDPEARTVYINLDNKRVYIKMSGTLVEISKVLELGSTETTAYRGDYGNQNYTNIQNILSGETSFAGQKTFAAIKSSQSVEESDDLANKAYVDSAITAVKANAFKVEQTLPEENQEEGIIYLIPVANTNYYTQYIWENSGWLNIGDTQIDLSGKADLSNGKVSMSQLYDVEIVTYSDSTPLTALQLEKAKKGKLAIAVTNVSGLTAFTAVICLFAGDYDANNYRFNGIFTLSTGGSYVPKKLFISNFAIKVNKTTGAFDQSGNNFDVISDDNDNFFSSSTDPTSSGKKIVRELNVYNKLLPTIQSVLGDRVLKVGSQNTQAEWAPEIKPMVDMTWAALKALRDAGNLIPGQQYRITDYACTTTETLTASAGHQFDIIVTADGASTLNENARACKHYGDTYFSNSDLKAWKLKYCLDNDTSRFDWADATNGKGVVYWMRDEFDNECCYDFKNIQFLEVPSFIYNKWGKTDTFYRDASKDIFNNGVQYYGWSANSAPIAWNEPACLTTDYPITSSSTLYTTNGSTTLTGGNITSISTASLTAFTFGIMENNVPIDASINGIAKEVYSNKIGPSRSYRSNHKLALGRNYFYNSTSNAAFNCNEIEASCFDCHFGPGCKNIHVGSLSYNLTFKYNCSAIFVNESCENITIESESYALTIGCRCNTIKLTNAYQTSIGNYCTDITVVGTIGYSTICDGINSIYISDGLKYCFIGPGCTCISTISGSDRSLENCTFDARICYVQLENNGSNDGVMKNIHVHSGVEGSSYANPINLTINNTDGHLVDYYPRGSEAKVL